MDVHINHNQDHAGISDHVEALFDSVKEYSKTNIDLIKLKAADKASEIVASAVSTVVMALVMLLFIIIFSVGLALLLGELLGKTYYGFFALAALYLIIGLILNSSKSKWFKSPVADVMIKKMFN